MNYLMPTYPSGSASTLARASLDVPQTLQEARKEAFDLYWTASFLAFGAIVGLGRTIYCQRQKQAGG